MVEVGGVRFLNILMITANDPAGMGMTFTNAINRYTDHTCRLITSQDRYGIDFGKDIHLPDIHDDDFGEVEQLLIDADIIHFHMLSDENSHLGPLVIRDYIKGKKIIHHHHGHPDYILNVDAFNEKYKRLKRKVIVSTPDLLKIADNSTWVPNMVPLFDVDYMPRYDSSLPQDLIKICQAPTRKYDKHTREFQAAFDQCLASKLTVEKVVIERVSHKKCLQLKKQCHIVFDHMRGWFGISSLESLAQGKPVIAGLDDWNIKCIKSFTASEVMPWHIARDREELNTVLKKLITDGELRTEAGKRSREFMESCWKETDALQVLINIYSDL